LPFARATLTPREYETHQLPSSGYLSLCKLDDSSGFDAVYRSQLSSSAACNRCTLSCLHSDVPEKEFRSAQARHPPYGRIAAPINELVNILLPGEGTLTRGERELIATRVSWRNDGFCCQTIHGTVAAAQLRQDENLNQTVKTDWINCISRQAWSMFVSLSGRAIPA
jgi:hypothetical protein